nr:immunoglobulin light chain junction region [Macaca mulatta]MPN97030.1 immunoglobulin light chain junction region [Macaca mulatta]MPO00267.1 immunoglobulin light chain junction region [Macaca mulatta]MPO00566.1 immunoglobulin light chain junction region [Macaca mulatta]MPO01917.1 immunoglobulin light chain junction region [Macaca mulatta]
WQQHGNWPQLTF